MAVHSYMRISTLDKGQSVENQRIAINEAGYATTYWYAEEGVSGSVKATERPEFKKMMAAVNKNDLVVVTALDRLGRDAEDILNTVNNFEKLGVRVCILALGQTDVTSVMGKAFVTMLSALAEMERNELRMRTRRGLKRVESEGRILGPRLKLDPQKMRTLFELKKEKTLDEVASILNINRNSVATNLKRWGGKLHEYEAEWAKREVQYKASEPQRIIRAELKRKQKEKVAA